MSNKTSIIWSLSAKGETEVISRGDVQCPSMEEFVAGSDVQDQLVQALMLGKLDRNWKRSIENKTWQGTPMESDKFKNQRSSLAKLYDLPPQKIRDAWSAHVDEARAAQAGGKDRRIHGASLQKLKALCFPGKPREKKITVAQIVAAWESMPESWRMDPQAEAFYDVMVEAGSVKESSH